MAAALHLSSLWGDLRKSWMGEELQDVYVLCCLHRRAGTGNTASAALSCVPVVAMAALASLEWTQGCKIRRVGWEVAFGVDTNLCILHFS